MHFFLTVYLIISCDSVYFSRLFWWHQNKAHEFGDTVVYSYVNIEKYCYFPDLFILSSGKVNNNI